MGFFIRGVGPGSSRVCEHKGRLLNLGAVVDNIGKEEDIEIGEKPHVIKLTDGVL
jgi:hypothetical protein